MDLKTLLDRAPKPDESTGLFTFTDHNLAGNALCSFDLPIVPSKSDELVQQKGSQLRVRVKFTPYAALRQQFWHKYLRQYDTDDSGTYNQVEIWSMLDSLGSTLTHKTLDDFYARFGKKSDATLTAEQVVLCLESQLVKPRAERRHIDSSLNSGWQTPAALEPTLDGPNGIHFDACVNLHISKLWRRCYRSTNPGNGRFRNCTKCCECCHCATYFL